MVSTVGPFHDRTAKTFFAVHPGVGVQLYPAVDIQDNRHLDKTDEYVF